jgi:hypothetical protein
MEVHFSYPKQPELTMVLSLPVPRAITYAVQDATTSPLDDSSGNTLHSVILHVDIMGTLSVPAVRMSWGYARDQVVQ